MVGFPSLSLGAVATTTYTGTLTPTVSTYKLGGGGGTLILRATTPSPAPTPWSSATRARNRGPRRRQRLQRQYHDQRRHPATRRRGGHSQRPRKGNVAVSGLLDLAGNSTTINGLSGSGSVDNSGTGATTLTVGANNASSTFAGLITNSGTAVAAGATLSLVKTGSGVLTLTGTNAYTGQTTVSGGTLVVADPGALPSQSLISVGRAGQINLCGLLEYSPRYDGAVVESGREHGFCRCGRGDARAGRARLVDRQRRRGGRAARGERFLVPARARAGDPGLACRRRPGGVVVATAAAPRLRGPS